MAFPPRSVSCCQSRQAYTVVGLMAEVSKYSRLLSLFPSDSGVSAWYLVLEVNRGSTARTQAVGKSRRGEAWRSGRADRSCGWSQGNSVWAGGTTEGSSILSLLDFYHLAFASHNMPPVSSHAKLGHRSTAGDRHH